MIMYLIPNDVVAGLLSNAEYDIKNGLEQVYRRKGIEEGMRRIHKGIGELQTAKLIIERQTTVDVNVNIKK
jgi:hypothetical protein